ncbi:hypothetical protein ACET3Z_028322 [Daucus carota]
MVMFHPSSRDDDASVDLEEGDGKSGQGDVRRAQGDKNLHNNERRAQSDVSTTQDIDVISIEARVGGDGGKDVVADARRTGARTVSSSRISRDENLCNTQDEDDRRIESHVGHNVGVYLEKSDDTAAQGGDGEDENLHSTQNKDVRIEAHVGASGGDGSAVMFHPSSKDDDTGVGLEEGDGKAGQGDTRRAQGDKNLHNNERRDQSDVTTTLDIDLSRIEARVGGDGGKDVVADARRAGARTVSRSRISRDKNLCNTQDENDRRIESHVDHNAGVDFEKDDGTTGQGDARRPQGDLRTERRIRVSRVMRYRLCPLIVMMKLVVMENMWVMKVQLVTLLKMLFLRFPFQ